MESKRLHSGRDGLVAPWSSGLPECGEPLTFPISSKARSCWRLPKSIPKPPLNLSHPFNLARQPDKRTAKMTKSKLIGFVATRKPAAARKFYEKTLGLTLASDDPFAVVFDSKGTMLRVEKVFP